MSAKSTSPNSPRRSANHWVGPLAIGLAVASWISPAQAGMSIEFPFHDDTLLLKPQKDGGLVYIPTSIPRGESAPLVIFLHGINDRQGVHLWMGSPVGPFDLRASWDAWIGEAQ